MLLSSLIIALVMGSTGFSMKTSYV